MKIDNKEIILFTTRITRDVFFLSTYSTDSGRYSVTVFRQNDENAESKINRILYIFKSQESSNFIFAGWDNHKVDNTLINYIIDNSEFVRVYDIYIHYLGMNEDSYSEHAKHFFSIDLKKVLFNKNERKGLSLRKMVFSMNLSLSKYNKTKDLTNLSEEEIKDIALKEIMALKEIFEANMERISYRRHIYETFKVNCLSSSDDIIGIQLLNKRYSQISRMKYSDYCYLRSNPSYVLIRDIIKYNYSFKNHALRNFWSSFNTLAANPAENAKKSFNYTIFCENIPFKINSNGVRTENSTHISEGNIYSIDFQSMYPSIMLLFDLFPRHLDDNFKETIKRIYNERIEAKTNGNKHKDKSLKMILNSSIGMMNNDWCWLYDLNTALSIRMNAMKMTMALVDLIIYNRGKILSVNTDGVYAIINNENIIEEIKNYFPISLSIKKYEKMWQLTTTDYILKNGENIVLKGIFSDSNIGKEQSTPPIVKKAIIDNLLYNKPIIETINGCNDLMQFVVHKYFDKKFLILENDVVINNYLRYYYSIGADSYKITKRTEGKESIADQTSGVCIYEGAGSELKNIDRYAYYGLTNKILNKFQQQNLFDIFV